MAGKTPIYNPQTGETTMVPNEQVFKWNNAVRKATGGTPAFGWYYNPEGEHVFGPKPEESYFDPFLEGLVQGKNPYPPGPGPLPYIPGRDVRWDPDGEVYPDYDADAPTYRDTGPLFPWQPGEGRPTAPIDWRGPGGGVTPAPQTPQFGSSAPDYGDMWTRQYDIGAGFAGQHKDFYDTQFRNLSAQQQSFQDDQIRAAMRRQAAIDNPQQAAPVDWSWANDGQGLPNVQVSQGDAYTMNPTIQPGMTNQQLFDAFVPRLSQGAQDWFANMDPSVAEGTGLVARTLRTPSPGAWVAQDNTTAPSNMPYINELANALYISSGANNGVPAGYAMPRSGGE